MKFLSFQRSAITEVSVLSDIVTLIHHPCSRAADDRAGMGFDGFTGMGFAVLKFTRVSCNSQLELTTRSSGLTRLTCLKAPFQPVWAENTVIWKHLNCAVSVLPEGC